MCSLQKLVSDYLVTELAQGGWGARGGHGGMLRRNHIRVEIERMTP